MSSTIDVRVPDIGDFKDIPVIEVFVKPGDTVKKNDSLLTLESDKAAMEVPSSADGKVVDVKVKLGDKVSEGTVIVTLETADTSTSAPSTSLRSAGDDKGESAASSSRAETQSAGVEGQLPSGSNATVELVVPDVGDFTDIPVIEVLIKPGDTVAKEASLIVLESDKASMEVPSTAAGVVQDVKLKVGDKVSKGTVIATLATSASEANASGPSTAALRASASGPSTSLANARSASGPSTPALRASAQDDGGAASAGKETAAAVGGVGTQSLSSRAERSEVEGRLPSSASGIVHASPSIRRFARELGVALQSLRGSGPNGRITREDVQRYVKSALQSGVASAGAAAGGGFAFAGLPAWPRVDFAQYGEIERVPLSRIKKLSGPNLHRNWVQIPHITNYDEADVTDLEAFRNEVNAERGKAGGAKLTMLAFLVKASVAALQKFPDFNSSLDGDALVHKHYYNIGFAADTPNGLVVPVLKNAQSKGLLEVAQESSDLAAKARDGKLALGDMQGGTFTISSIGGIGGTAFTQIVNAPEVAILGATRAAIKPVWNGKEFAPRLVLPVSVSYDHRVIDGASAARFLVYLTTLLKDFRRTAL